eukprot:gene10011-7157_t
MSQVFSCTEAAQAVETERVNCHHFRIHTMNISVGINPQKGLDEGYVVADNICENLQYQRFAGACGYPLETLLCTSKKSGAVLKFWAVLPIE